MGHVLGIPKAEGPILAARYEAVQRLTIKYFLNWISMGTGCRPWLRESLQQTGHLSSQVAGQSVQAPRNKSVSGTGSLYLCEELPVRFVIRL